VLIIRNAIVNAKSLGHSVRPMQKISFYFFLDYWNDANGPLFPPPSNIDWHTCCFIQYILNHSEMEGLYITNTTNSAAFLLCCPLVHDHRLADGRVLFAVLSPKKISGNHLQSPEIFVSILLFVSLST
jgi:hypothetical protein